MYKKMILVMVAIVMALSVFSGCTGDNDGDGDAVSKLKIGVVYIGNISEPVGFSTEHYKGIMAAAKSLGIKESQILQREEVSDNDESCKEVFESLIANGCNVIIGTSYGYGTYMNDLANDPAYKDIIFMHCSGEYKNDVNFSNFFGRMYQARYLTGIVAGLKTETNKIGYVAAVGIPEVIRGINAFTLGVKSVNPDAEVIVRWTNTWGNPSIEKSTAETLISEGCDVITQHQDTDAAQIAARENKVWAIGYHSDMAVSSKEYNLTSAIWNLEAYYEQQFTDIINGEWKPGVAYWGGIKEGVVDIAPLSDNVAEGTQAKVDEVLAKFKDGSFDVFANYEIKDQDGNVKVTADSKLTDEELLSMMWFVEGVVGTID
jgi:basic membrane protein A